MVVVPVPDQSDKKQQPQAGSMFSEEDLHSRRLNHARGPRT